MDYSVDDIQGRYDLKEQIMDMNLESLYQSYIGKIRRNYLSTFIIIHLVLSAAHSLAILFAHEGSNAPYDVYFIIVGAAITCLCIRPFMSEKYTNSHPSVPFMVSWVASLVMALTGTRIRLKMIPLNVII
ncbi:hypothetical protein GQX74_014468 [Glossina fuscipes]|nr:hypothetical protein GQX74_014468 [Glossina fuscipes]